ncbi:hypothetical protein [Kitasatospora sp. NPDC058218]|uniref:hypothetical protein n=1 Tax=Kitasatospora sp. NPDC058218 TaxID=3346385 RepID=UPI0036DA29B4
MNRGATDRSTANRGGPPPTDTGTVDLPGARSALGRGTAVVLPNPAPLTSVVAATGPGTVNAAKGRPVGQPVALWAHHPDTLAALDEALALAAPAAALAGRLLAEEHLTLLVPLRADGPPPGWLAPAAKDGWALLFGASWAPLRPLLARFPLLYVSSANRTGRPPAARAADAVAMFPPGTAVLGTADLPGADTATEPVSPGPTGPTGPTAPEPARRATTTLRLHPDGSLDLYRHGAQDHRHGDTATYLRHLRRTYRAPDRRTATDGESG